MAAMPATPATIGEALETRDATIAIDPGLARDLALAIREIARDRNARTPPRGLWISGPRGSGKSAILGVVAGAIERRDRAPAPDLADAIDALADLDPTLVRVDVTRSADAITRAILDAVTSSIGAPPSPPPPSPRAMADAIAAIWRAHREGSKILILVIDDAGAIDREVLRPALVHLLLRGKGKVAVIATGEHPPRDDGGAIEACFPDAQRVRVSDAAALAIVRDRALAKTKAAWSALADRGAPNADLYPLDPAVLERVGRVTQATRASGAALGESPGPIDVVSAMISGAKSRPFGALVPMDDAFTMLAPWLSDGASSTVDRAGAITPHAARVARTIALLEVLAPERPATRDEIEIAMRDHIDASPRDPHLDASLDALIAAGLATRTSRHGHVLVTPRIDAWIADRATGEVTGEEVSQIVRDEIAALLDRIEPPPGPDGPTCFRAVYADGRRAHDEAILDRGGGTVLPLDVRHLPLYRRTREEWLGRSVRGNLVKRLIWIAEGDLAAVQDVGRDLAQSRRQLRRAAPVLGRPPPDLARMIDLESARRDDLSVAMRAAVERTFFEGTFYFRGEAMPARTLGDRFESALLAACAAVIPRVFEAPPPPPAPVIEAPLDEVIVALPRGREVHSTEEIEAVLGDIERRVRAALDRGAKRVKLV